VLPALFRLHDVTYSVLAMFGAVPDDRVPCLRGRRGNNDLRTELAAHRVGAHVAVSAQRFVLAEVLLAAIFSFAGATLGAGIVLASMFGSRLRETLTGRGRSCLTAEGRRFMGVDTRWRRS
jgi:hypothetical protein